MRLRTLGIGLAAAAAVAGVAALGTLRGWWILHPWAAHRYAPWGVDVSHHQGA